MDSADGKEKREKEREENRLSIQSRDMESVGNPEVDHHGEAEAFNFNEQGCKEST